MAKAKSVGTKILDEDEFYELVENSAEKRPSVAPPPPPKAAKGKGKAKATETDTDTS